jgi:glutamate N-acetyltransferase/amino-acid N-acetyltransferase
MSTGVAGFRFCGVASGIKPNPHLDLALAVADEPAVAAAVFTRNLVRAAPVQVAAQRVRSGTVRALLANSGCANACTGRAGLHATLDSTAAVAEALSIPAEQVLPASTGVIGELLPAERIIGHAQQLVASLRTDGHNEFAKAILTTDRFPKVARATVEGGAVVLGIAKGAGMIHPSLGAEPPGTEPRHATLLGFLFTDATLERGALEQALVRATDETFNAISVDGDTSTNDTVFAMASGASGQRVATDALTSSLTRVCDELAHAVVTDGEGAGRVAEIVVRGIATNAEARRVAETIATSVLLKTAMHGDDPNWGRIVAAAGRAGVPFYADQACVSIGGVQIVQHGLGQGADAEQRARAVMATPSYVIEVVLGQGPGTARYLTCDLGPEYVKINAGYRT